MLDSREFTTEELLADLISRDPGAVDPQDGEITNGSDGEAGGTSTETEGASPPAAADTPAGLTWEAIEEALKSDPTLSQRFQSETDRRAAAQAKAIEQQTRERTVAEERQRIRDEYAEVVRTAAVKDDYDPKVAEARAKLADMEHAKLLREQWEAEVLPELSQRERTAVVQALDGAYGEFYQRHPALAADPEAAARLHHTKFTDANAWLTALSDYFLEQGRTQAQQTLIPEAEAVARRDALAEARERIPTPDTGPARAATGTRQFRTQSDVAGAYARDEINAAEYVYWRDALRNAPFMDEEGAA